MGGRGKGDCGEPPLFRDGISRSRCVITGWPIAVFCPKYCKYVSSLTLSIQQGAKKRKAREQQSVHFRIY